MFTVRSCTFSTSSTSLNRSWVSGRRPRPDPDGQVPVALLLFEQDNRAVGRHLNPDADDLHPPHWSSVLARAQRYPVPMRTPGPLSEPNHSSCQTTPAI